MSQSIFLVAAEALNCRSGPGTAFSVITTLPKSHRVTVLSKTTATWWEISTVISRQRLRGYVAARFLTPISESRRPKRIPSVATTKNASLRADFRPTPIHLPTHPKSLISSTDFRHVPLFWPKADNFVLLPNSSPGARRQRLLAIVDALNVEDSARYTPSQTQTFCNIYAYDFTTLFGVYFPRVWWTDDALVAQSKGQRPVPRYGITLREMTANAISIWLDQFGKTYGWKRLKSTSALQRHVNNGAMGIIVARHLSPSRSGHISVVLPETPDFRARTALDGGLIPVQSQAGRQNRKRFAEAWYLHRANHYADIGFWINRSES